MCDAQMGWLPVANAEAQSQHTGSYRWRSRRAFLVACLVLCWPDIHRFVTRRDGVDGSGNVLLLSAANMSISLIILHDRLQVASTIGSASSPQDLHSVC
jgi:hypothetical protein